MIIDAFQLFTTEILARHMPSPMKQSIPTFLTKFMHITDRDWSVMYEMCIWDVLIYISLRVLEILTCSYLAWVACLVILTPCNIRDTHKKACGICRMQQILSSLIISIHGKKDMPKLSIPNEFSKFAIKKSIWSNLVPHLNILFGYYFIMFCIFWLIKAKKHISVKRMYLYITSQPKNRRLLI